MTGLIWSRAGNASDVFLLVAAIVAWLDALMVALRGAPEAALVPAAVALIALGLLAL